MLTYADLDLALARLDRMVSQEPDVDTTISVLRGLKFKYEAHHGVRIADGV